MRPPLDMHLLAWPDDTAAMLHCGVYQALTSVPGSVGKTVAASWSRRAGSLVKSKSTVNGAFRFGAARLTLMARPSDSCSSVVVLSIGSASSSPGSDGSVVLPKAAIGIEVERRRCTMCWRKAMVEWWHRKGGKVMLLLCSG
jgi:hypothetical protein